MYTQTHFMLIFQLQPLNIHGNTIIRLSFCKTLN